MARWTVFVCLFCSFPCVFSGYGDISRKKCLEYANAVYSDQKSLVGPMSRPTERVSECGIVSVPLIIGGQEAKEKEFPHMALIGYGESPNDKLAWNCGGALISETFVLSAAHCAGGQRQKVKLGMTTIDEDAKDEDIQEIPIVKVFRHPDYKKPVKYNDIALFQLESAAVFTPYVRPACLNVNLQLPLNKATATGFGKTALENREINTELMKVDLDIIKQADCQRFFKKVHVMREGVKDSMICGGHLPGGKDTCQGDSGGPLQVVLDDPYCMYAIIGVTSFGKFCGFANSPAIYTNVSYFVPWIESIVWGR